MQIKSIYHTFLYCCCKGDNDSWAASFKAFQKIVHNNKTIKVLCQGRIDQLQFSRTRGKDHVQQIKIRFTPKRFRFEGSRADNLFNDKHYQLSSPLPLPCPCGLKLPLGRAARQATADDIACASLGVCSETPPPPPPPLPLVEPLFSLVMMVPMDNNLLTRRHTHRNSKQTHSSD